MGKQEAMKEQFNQKLEKIKERGAGKAGIYRIQSFPPLPCQ